MGDLSLNFSLKEFECRCCHAVKPDRVLVESLQTLRNMLGRPIYIASGFRCAAHNKASGGVVGSQHVVGKAADIVARGLSVHQMFHFAERVPAFLNGGIGAYPTQHFVHVDVRGCMARWTG